MSWHAAGILLACALSGGGGWLAGRVTDRQVNMCMRVIEAQRRRILAYKDDIAALNAEVARLKGALRPENPGREN